MSLPRAAYLVQAAASVSSQAALLSVPAGVLLLGVATPQRAVGAQCVLQLAQAVVAKQVGRWTFMLVQQQHHPVGRCAYPLVTVATRAVVLRS